MLNPARELSRLNIGLRSKLDDESRAVLPFLHTERTMARPRVESLKLAVRL